MCSGLWRTARSGGGANITSNFGFWGTTMASSTAGSGAPGSTHRTSRDALLGMLDQYLDAVIEHDPSSLPLAQNLRVTEDGKATKLGEGVWKTIAALTYRQSIVDPFTGEAGFFGVALEK